jgi:CRP-like cAMP-binding protein
MMETVRSKAYEATLEKLLKSDRFFSQLSEKIVQELVARAQFVVYPPGEIIIRAGDKADAFYIVLEGDARVFEQPETKTPERLNHLRPGDLMGELGLQYDRPRSASIHALGQTTVARFDRGTWEWLIASVPHLSQELEQRFQGYTQYIQTLKLNRRHARMNYLTARKTVQRRRMLTKHSAG